MPMIFEFNSSHIPACVFVDFRALASIKYALCISQLTHSNGATLAVRGAEQYKRSYQKKRISAFLATCMQLGITKRDDPDPLTLYCTDCPLS